MKTGLWNEGIRNENKPAQVKDNVSSICIRATEKASTSTPCSMPQKCFIQRPAMFIDTDYQAQCPPSILRSAPVMNELASLSKKTAAPRYSLGSLSLPSIFCVGQSRFLSGNFSNSASTIAVTI